MEEALDLSRRTGDRLAANNALRRVAQVAWASGDHERAYRYFRRSLAVASELADKVNAAYCMQGLAVADWERGEPLRTVRLLGAAEALLQSAGTTLYAQADHDLHQRLADTSRESLGEDAWTAAWEKGRGMSLEGAVAYALAERGPTARPARLED